MKDELHFILRSRNNFRIDRGADMLDLLTLQITWKRMQHEEVGSVSWSKNVG